MNTRSYIAGYMHKQSADSNFIAAQRQATESAQAAAKAEIARQKQEAASKDATASTKKSTATTSAVEKAEKAKQDG